MKKQFRFLGSALLCSALLFSSCSKEEETTTPDDQTVTAGTILSFESIEGMLDVNKAVVAPARTNVWSGTDKTATPANIFWGKLYSSADKNSIITETEEGTLDTTEVNCMSYDGLLFTDASNSIKFGSYYHNYTDELVYDTWAGFVISEEYQSTLPETLDFNNQFAAYGTSKKVASANRYFLNAYDMSDVPDTKYTLPTIEFTRYTGAISLYITNNAYAASYAHTEDFKVIITGYRGTTVAFEKEVLLVDIENTTTVSDWVKVDLDPSVNINKLTFKVETKDPMAPKYFCVDYISLK